MIRIVFTYVIPFLFPTAAYLVWAWYRGRYAAAHGGAPPKLESGPWPVLLFLGALLTLGSLGFTALTRGSDAGSIYTPSHIVNGTMVPGRMDEKPR